MRTIALSSVKKLLWFSVPKDFHFIHAKQMRFQMHSICQKTFFLNYYIICTMVSQRTTSLFWTSGDGLEARVDRLSTLWLTLSISFCTRQHGRASRTKVKSLNLKNHKSTWNMKIWLKIAFCEALCRHVKTMVWTGSLTSIIFEKNTSQFISIAPVITLHCRCFRKGRSCLIWCDWSDAR